MKALYFFSPHELNFDLSQRVFFPPIIFKESLRILFPQINDSLLLRSLGPSSRLAHGGRRGGIHEAQLLTQDNIQKQRFYFALFPPPYLLET